MSAGTKSRFDRRGNFRERSSNPGKHRPDPAEGGTTAPPQPAWFRAPRKHKRRPYVAVVLVIVVVMVVQKREPKWNGWGT